MTTTDYTASLTFRFRLEGTDEPTRLQLVEAALRALAEGSLIEILDSDSDIDIGGYDPWGHLRPADDPKDDYYRKGEA